jgi:hypothetical protein
VITLRRVFLYQFPYDFRYAAAQKSSAEIGGGPGYLLSSHVEVMEIIP